MKNKNTTLIKNIRRMIDQTKVQTEHYKAWKESWEMIIEKLERGEEV
jgi:hypothetical protein